MELKLLAKHFKTAEYITKYARGAEPDYQGCAIEQAAAEVFKDKRIEESPEFLKIDEQKFIHFYYGMSVFNEDKEEAAAHDYDDTVIRTLKLTLQK